MNSLVSIGVRTLHAYRCVPMCVLVTSTSTCKLHADFYIANNYATLTVYQVLYLVTASTFIL